MPPTYGRTPRRVPTAHARVMRRRAPKRRMIRRRPYVRRRVRRRPTTLVSLLKHRRWQVVRNPFSLATTNPKFPDNRTTFSSGQRLQVSGQVKHGNGPHMCIVMFPGLSNGIFISDNIGGTGLFWAPPYNNHLEYEIPATPTDLREKSIEKWRVVSQGLRLSLVTNTEENDGYFEYIRVPVDTSKNKWYFADTVKPGGGLVFVPEMPEVSHLTAENMVDHVTYQSGKLRDIHRYLFTCHPSGEDHEFRNNSSDYPYNTGVNLHYSAANNQTKGAGGGAIYDTILSNPSSIKDWIDTSYGMVVIKIHGNENSRLLYHMVSNMEFIYDQGSPLARFHTRSYQV